MVDPRNAKVSAKIRQIAAARPRRVMQAVYRRGQAIMTRSKEEFVPVDEGTLRGSGEVEDPIKVGNNISTKLKFGGAAGSYAIPVHEDPEAHHDIGSWKYLERPLKDARSTLARDLAKDLRLDEY